jgi:hypothetical protein
VWEAGLDEWLEDLPYYVVEIEITHISFPPGILGGLLSKIHQSGTLEILDKTTLEDVQKYSQRFAFRVPRGYFWRKVSEEDRERVSEFVAKEYEEKKNAKTEEERKLAKLKLNSLYGYTLKRGLRKLKSGKKGTWEIQLRENAPMIESINEEEHSFFVRNTYDLSFNHTALGVAILSQTHRIMYELIKRCDDEGIPIYHCHTDSLAIPAECLSARVPHRLECFRDLMGDRLGALKIEYAAKSAEIVFSGKYRLTLTDGTQITKGKFAN